MYTVLAILAHPDDMEIACGGTLLKCRERGDRVVSCYLCSGSMGHVVIMPDELRAIRAAEAKKSADMGDFEVLWGGFDDLDLYESKEARDRVVDIIRRVDPDFIITHAPNDYMSDHTATSKLVFDAAFSATCPHYETKEKDVAKMVPIYYAETSNGIDFHPTEYVNITPYIDKKLEMARCHASQVQWLLDHDGVDFIEQVRISSKYRGYQCGATYAEGFTQCRTDMRLSTKRYLP